MNDPVQDIKKSEAVDLKVPQDDPELNREVENFIASQSENKPEPTQEQKDEKIRVKIPPDDKPLGQSADDVLMTEALLDVEKLSEIITDQEKDLFVKSILSDTPFRLGIKLFGGKMAVNVRSRSTHEQMRVFQIVDMDRKEKLFEENDFAMMITRTQQYCAAIMIESTNGVEFSTIKLDPGSKLEDDAKIMREFLTKNLAGLVGIRWTALVNSMRWFESKCAKLNTMAANDDFWKPRATG